MSRARAEATVFHAIACPTRRALLERLRSKEDSVTRLAERFGVSQPAISQQLRVLKDAGLVIERREGRHKYYQLSGRPLEEVASWVKHYESFWKTKLKSLGEHLDKRS
jgi:DNA-binding transcriptional ArsR family regulator